MDIKCPHLLQNAWLTSPSKLEVQVPEVQGQRKLSVPCQVQGPMMASIVRCCGVGEESRAEKVVEKSCAERLVGEGEAGVEIGGGV